ncbi:hypothetical protein CKN73_01295 [Carnobacterium divergens]|uniref:ImmA/IrrE family metallo-endopeptidase n=1 Tax=Carnobacterium divergens TaxID=2748 RepID=UPI001072AAB7|nr:hypothetical protein [Carnobacterium divergens]TFJ45106.1 hypothetical protein CKN77_01290 [Carnobacterium divergens]TFJ52175.1 hypothetical protein CKN73_01295 [Carnobacterium divergens]TFJ57752.1 hypothetical protein CKN83_01290 [Carnobacterium divergens]TFJ65767.1 hypothetical protein CKN89_01295 [Carnobacterium divergens]TFJ74072.1 hypothetical protein CKN91_01290 [Carnobacterium divergens]
MNRLEKIIDDNQHLDFKFNTSMNSKHGAFIYGNNVYVNSKREYEQNIADIAEEIGHDKTSAGDLSCLNTIEKRQQETRARQWGYKYLVPLDDLIVCYKLGLREYWEVAEFLEIPPAYLWETINYYRDTKGLVFYYKGCQFVFGISDSLKIYFN